VSAADSPEETLDWRVESLQRDLDQGWTYVFPGSNHPFESEAPHNYDLLVEELEMARNGDPEEIRGKTWAILRSRSVQGILDAREAR
jgi:hypothetical protein